MEFEDEEVLGYGNGISVLNDKIKSEADLIFINNSLIKSGVVNPLIINFQLLESYNKEEREAKDEVVKKDTGN
jgi:hypothetical protein